MIQNGDPSGSERPLAQRYPYNPRWSLIAYCLATGSAIMGLIAIGWISLVGGLILGGLPIAGALILALRRLVLPRFLELRQDSLFLPTGFFQIRTTEIPFAEIEWTRDSTLPLTGILALRAKGRTFSIPSTLLPDEASFVALRNSINSLSRSKERKAGAAAQRDPNEGRRYHFQCSYEGDGQIYDSDGECLWRFRTEGRSDRRPMFTFVPAYGLFRLPDFVVYDKAEKEWLRIRRERRLPMARFVVLENGSRVCTIRQRSFLLNRYQLDFASGANWKFHMRLFTVFFNGISDKGARVRVRLWSHNVWYLLMEPGLDDAHLVAALAFIHRERLRCV